jgi:hypothetical protein
LAGAAIFLTNQQILFCANSFADEQMAAEREVWHLSRQARASENIESITFEFAIWLHSVSLAG